ncbi:MAG: dihydroorotate dehydrogenase electron transfer subunit [Bacillota bacterium]
MARQATGEILANQQLTEIDYKMVISLPELAAEIDSGQFLHVRCTDGLDPLLRRPISIYRYQRQAGTLEIVYRVFGAGTKALAKRETGEVIDVMGPLGNGFELDNIGEKVVVIGGGIGTAPLVALLDDLVALDKEVTAIVGAQTKEELFCLDELKEMPIELQIATDDGSLGHEGFVTELLTAQLEEIDYDQAFACGPTPMLRAVQSIVNEDNLEAQLSLEERMGCGTGACLSCVCEVEVAAGADVEYRKVCTDGPVFKATEVILDE